MTGATLNQKRYEMGWLLSPSYDLTLIVGVFAVAAASGVVVHYNPALFLYVFLADLWLLGYHHVISTFTKLAGTREDRRENRFLIYYLPFIVLAAVAAGATFVGVWLIITIYFFWQWYHYVRQAYGIATFYLRRQTRPAPQLAEEKWINNLVIWSVPVWGVLHRCYQGWDEFLFNEVWLPSVPLFAVQLAATVSIGSFMVWVATRFLAWHQSRLSVAHTMFMLSHVAAFYIGYIALDHINIGWLAANIWHNAQYILFVWLYNTNRFKNPEQHKGEPVAWFSQRKLSRVILYFGISLLATTALYGALSVAFKAYAQDNLQLLTLLYVMSFQTINFHHYVVDSLIWKARHKKNSTVMNLNG